MASQWGKYLELAVFGESHGRGIGITIGRLPAGLETDEVFIRRELGRRAPGRSALSTPRKEEDLPEILSGVYQGYTTGAPLTAFIPNTDTRSGDYAPLEALMRPGHSNYPAQVKYRGYNDIRGGGHFSGRLTAALVFAGALAKLALRKRGILIASHIASIKDIQDAPLGTPDEALLERLLQSDFPLVDPALYPEMEARILTAKAEKDSVGGSVEVCILGVPAGLGEPFFYSLESSLASLVFSVPSIKGLEFGEGFALTQKCGSEANDAYRYLEDGSIGTKTCRQGGILGGLSIGSPIRFRAAVKPTPSIGLPQNTVNIKTKSNDTLTLTGRHDPCIVPRICVVLEAAAALSIWDMLLGETHES